MSLLNELHVVLAADAAAQPWKNGGGVTRELLRLPADGDWDLRISLADIDADGPFSPFEGVERWFAVIEGAGVLLRWPGREHRMTPAAWPLRFDGADAPDCRLLGSSTRDLNLMTRDRPSTLLMPAVVGRPFRWFGSLRGVFTLEPLVLEREHGEPVELPAHALAWQRPGDGAAWQVRPTGDAGAASAHTGEVPPAYFFVAPDRAAP